MSKVAKEVPRVANKTEAFDPPLIPEKRRKNAIEEIYDLSVYLEKQLTPLAAEMRRHLVRPVNPAKRSRPPNRKAANTESGQ
jgi:hypothetical protein